MKVKVLVKFTDKYTHEIYNKGDVLTITETRYEEIMSVGQFVQKLCEIPARSPSDAVKVDRPDTDENPVKSNPAPSGDGFDIMSVRELREYADKAHKLTFGRGTKKSEMIETLRRMERGNK